MDKQLLETLKLVAQHKRAGALKRKNIKDKDSFDPEATAKTLLIVMYSQFEQNTPAEIPLKYFKGTFWEYQGTHYEPISLDTLKAKISIHLSGIFKGVLESHINAILDKLRKLGQVHDSSPMPSWIEDSKRFEPPKGNGEIRYTAVRNGLIDIDAFLTGEGEVLLPHSPRWFCQSCLPFEYAPEATCPNWKRVLSTNLNNDRELGRLLQEFFGYCLTLDTDFHSFLMLYGEGGTGKSATLGALRAMLGDTNVASVPLESMGDKFATFGMFGKLANIAAEIGEVDRVAEGNIKALTSGDLFPFEQKYKDTISAIPTAKLVFATNNLPRFNDKTDGIWRRMLIVPFNRRVPKSERIPGLDKPQGWANLGELSGMLNWSLEGLKRLHKNGRFTQSKAAEALKAQHRADCNPIDTFLEDVVNLDPTGTIPKSTLYGSYREFCFDSGHQPMNNVNFGKEVSRKFPTAKTKQPRDESGRKFKAWGGISMQ